MTYLPIADDAVYSISLTPAGFSQALYTMAANGSASRRMDQDASGVGVSVKHYAANNQEHERLRGSSNASTTGPLRL